MQKTPINQGQTIISPKPSTQVFLSQTAQLGPQKEKDPLILHGDGNKVAKHEKGQFDFLF